MLNPRAPSVTWIPDDGRGAAEEGDEEGGEDGDDGVPALTAPVGDAASDDGDAEAVSVGVEAGSAGRSRSAGESW
ncbi:MAG: hypothetical protein ABJ314_11225, partial [Ilumatobacter sp.]